MQDHAYDGNSVGEGASLSFTAFTGSLKTCVASVLLCYFFVHTCIISYEGIREVQREQKLSPSLVFQVTLGSTAAVGFAEATYLSLRQRAAMSESFLVGGCNALCHSTLLEGGSNGASETTLRKHSALESQVSSPGFSSLYPCSSKVMASSEALRRRIREERQAYRRGATDEPENNSLLNAARGKEVKYIPIWIMRQAGRYLPEFRELRSHHDFFELCQDPVLAAEISLQPFRRYPSLDATIIFSDILVIPQAMGQVVRMVDTIGPVFDERLKDPSGMKNLQLNPDVEKSLGYVFDAIYLLKKQLENKVPVIGFCGAPFSLLGYMVEGRSSREYFNLKKWLYDFPNESHTLLKAISDISVDYLVGQYDAGANPLQVFDTSASAVPPEVYEEFGTIYMLHIAEILKENQVVGGCLGSKEGAEILLKLFCRSKSVVEHFEPYKKVKERRPEALLIAFPKDRLSVSFRHSKYDVVGLGSADDPVAMRELLGPKITLQGNLDPGVLFAREEVIRKKTDEMIQKFGKFRYIANLGHGMAPGMDPESVRVLIDAVKQH